MPKYRLRQGKFGSYELGEWSSKHNLDNGAPWLGVRRKEWKVC